MRTARVRENEKAIASFERTRKSKSAPITEKRTTHYGNVLRRYREKAGMDQASVARAIGYSTNTISNWENGVSRPDIDAVPSLCALLRIPLTVFFDIPFDPASPQEEQELLHGFRQLGPARRGIASSIVRQMAEDEAAVKATVRSLKKSISLPLSPLSAAAGVSVPMEDVRGKGAVCLRDNPLARQADEIFLINGDSMEPAFPDGSMVYVRHANRVSPGEIGIFNVGGAPMIKEFQPQGLRSYNRAYRLIRLGDDDRVSCLGRVLGPVSPEDVLRVDKTDDEG